LDSHPKGRISLFSGVVGYQHFGRPCCIHLQGEVSGAWKWTQIQNREYKREYCHIWANRNSFSRPLPRVLGRVVLSGLYRTVSLTV